MGGGPPGSGGSLVGDTHGPDSGGSNGSSNGGTGTHGVGLSSAAGMAGLGVTGSHLTGVMNLVNSYTSGRDSASSMSSMHEMKYLPPAASHVSLFEIHPSSEIKR